MGTVEHVSRERAVERTGKAETRQRVATPLCGAADMTEFLVYLQRTVGNAAVNEFLHRHGDLSQYRPPWSPIMHRVHRALTPDRASTTSTIGPIPPVTALPAKMPPGVPIQRSLTVGTINYTDMYKKYNQDIPELINGIVFQIKQAIGGQPIEQAFNTHEARIRSQLKLWIEDEPGDKTSPKSHPEFGRKRQERAYRDYMSLAHALIGWVEAKPKRHEEKEYAGIIYENPVVNEQLNAVMRKIHTKIKELETQDPKVDAARAGAIRQELRDMTNQAGEAIGTYRQWYEQHHPTKVVEKNPLEALADPAQVSFRDKVAILHDLMEYFATAKHTHETKGTGLLPEPDADMPFTTGIGPGGAPIREPAGRANVPGAPNAVRDETNPGTQFARRHKIPVWASQSFTTARMLELGQWVGADTAELAAISWGIFAFWRLDYDHTSIAYHTLHEVMDVALNYGVGYNPLKPDQGLSVLVDQAVAQCRTYYLATDASLKKLVSAFPSDGDDILKEYVGEAEKVVGNIGRILDKYGADAARSPLEKHQLLRDLQLEAGALQTWYDGANRWVINDRKLHEQHQSFVSDVTRFGKESLDASTSAPKEHMPLRRRALDLQGRAVAAQKAFTAANDAPAKKAALDDQQKLVKELEVVVKQQKDLAPRAVPV